VCDIREDAVSGGDNVEKLARNRSSLGKVHARLTISGVVEAFVRGTERFLNRPIKSSYGHRDCLLKTNPKGRRNSSGQKLKVFIQEWDSRLSTLALCRGNEHDKMAD